MASQLRYIVFHQVLLCSLLIRKAESNVYLTVDDNIVTRNYGDNATITFYTHTNSIKPKLFLMEINQTEIAYGLENDFKKHDINIANHSRKLRNIYYNETSQSYSISMTNLSMDDDNMEIKASFIYVTNSRLMHSAQQIVKLQVLYGPTICNDVILPEITSLLPTENNNLSIILCGNPKPRVTWYHNKALHHDDKPLSEDLFTSRDLGNYKHSYTAYLNRDMCGKNISIRLADSGQLLHQWQVDLGYAPELAIKRAFIMEKCVHVLWTPISSCSGIKAQIQLLHENGSLLEEKEVHTNLGVAKLCNFTAFMNFSVRVRSVYSSFSSNWIEKDIYEVTKDLLYIESNTNIGVVGNSVDIPFHFREHIDKLVQGMFVHIGDTQVATGLTTRFTKSNKISSSLSSRLSAWYDEKSSTYMIRMSELTLLDDSNILGYVYYFGSSDISFKVKSFSLNTKLNVIGGPTLCGEEFIQNITMVTGHTNTFNFKLCGNPSLLVDIWMAGFALSMNLSEKIGNQYTYLVAIHNVTEEMCGETIKVLARVADQILYREIKVHVQYTPLPPVINEAYTITHCAYIKWLPIASGKCDGIKYDVQLTVEPGFTVAVELNDVIDTHAYYCNSAYIAMDRTMMRVRAKFGDTAGQWSVKKLDVLTDHPLVSTDSVNLTISHGNDANFKFNYNSTPSSNWMLRQAFMNVNNSYIAWGVGKSFIKRHNNTNIIKDRISVSYDDATKEYILTLKKIDFDDDGFNVMSEFLSTYKNNNKMPYLQSVTSTLIAVGGPFKCEAEITKEAILEIGNEVDFHITLCGKPKPDVLWKFNGVDRSSDEITDISASKFNYKYKIDSIDFSMCGKQLEYQATGYSGIIKNSTTILIKGSSPTVAIVTSYLNNNSCIYTLWKTANIGNCNGLTYQIQYITNELVLVHTSNLTADISDTLCDSSKLSHNITEVKVRSIYRNNPPSIWSTVAVNQTKPAGFTTPQTTTTSTTTSTTKTSTNPTTTASQKKEDDDNDDAMIAGIAGAGGFVFLIIVGVIIYCCYKKNKIAKPPGAELQKHVIHEYDVRNIQTRSNSYYKTTVNSNAVRTQNHSPIVQSVSNENVLYLNNLSYQDEESANKNGVAITFNESGGASRSNPAFELEEMEDDGYGTTNGFTNHGPPKSNGHAQT